MFKLYSAFPERLALTKKKKTATNITDNHSVRKHIAQSEKYMTKSPCSRSSRVICSKQ